MGLGRRQPEAPRRRKGEEGPEGGGGVHEGEEDLESEAEGGVPAENWEGAHRGEMG